MCYVREDLGQFDWCSNDKEWQVAFYMPEGAPFRCLSEQWPEDEKPDLEDSPPEVVVDAFEKRLRAYWINTRREESQRRIAWCRENMDALDYAWRLQKIKDLDEKIAELTEERKWHKDSVADLECMAAEGETSLELKPMAEPAAAS